MGLMRRKAALSELPQRVVDDRKATLRRVLSDFPDHLLAAMISGLELHGDNLRCGTLFASHDTSCAAGALIRELHPEQFEVGRVQFLLQHRWRRRAAAYGGELETGMHVTMLETIFDRAVVLTMTLRSDVSEKVASRVVGKWLLAEAEQELGVREDRRAAGEPPAISWRDLPLRRWGEDLEGRLGDRISRIGDRVLVFDA